MIDRFPSISTDGTQIAVSALPSGGQAIQYVGPAIGAWQPVPVEFDASGGVWQTSTDLLFVRNKDRAPDNGAILRWNMVTVSTFQPPGLEGWSCHNGNFAGWRRDDRLKAITVSEGGHRAGLVDLGGDVLLKVDGVEIDRGPIAEPRYTGEALVWCKWVHGVRRIFGRRGPGAPTEDLSWPFPDDEFWPLAIGTPLGLHLLTHGHPEQGRPLWLRPWGVGVTHGHVVAHGFTDRPDARAIERGMVLVAYSDLRSLQRVHVNLAAPLDDVRGPIVVPPVDPPPRPPDPPVDPPKETPVQLEAKHSDLIIAFERAFGMPGLSKEAGQEWVGKLASTFKARFPGEGWGTKRASPSRPLSNESIARPANGRLWSYDLIIGAGAAGQRLEPHAHAEDITDQVFVEVTAKDWLAGSSPTPNPTPTPTPQPTRPPFPSFVVQRDVFLDFYTKFIAGIYARDRFVENPPSEENEWKGTFICSRGATMLGVPVFYDRIIALISRKGNQLPTPEEWWRLADEGAAAAIEHYRRSVPPE